VAAPGARQRAYRWGVRAETLCAWWLRLRGYHILSQRYRNRFGETDIVARRGGVVAFIEVKARAGHEVALEAIATKQRRRIERSAMGFLAGYPNVVEHTVRFDVITVVPWRWPRHIIDAWRP
jgi:putative endonuclease